jgi:hypothetical protein
MLAEQNSSHSVVEHAAQQSYVVMAHKNDFSLYNIENP